MSASLTRPTTTTTTTPAIPRPRTGEPELLPVAEVATDPVPELPPAQYPWPEPWRSARGARPRSEFWDVATASWHSRGPWPRARSEVRVARSTAMSASLTGPTTTTTITAAIPRPRTGEPELLPVAEVVTDPVPELPSAQYPWPEPWRSARGARPRSEFWDVATASWHSRGPWPRTRSEV